MSDSDAIRLAYGGLSPKAVDTHIDRRGSVSAVVKAIVAGRTNLDPAVCDAVRRSAQERTEQLATLGVTFLERLDASFPARLGIYADAPRWLFANGVPSHGPSIGIVGSRACTSYGLELAEGYGAAAAAVGWVVVSGLARGVDAAAHRGALDAGGLCTAVLGSGIDVVYPRSNRGLHDRIVDRSGCVLSEFPPGTRPDAWRFPTRNLC